jgi:hypothetical protein
MYNCKIHSTTARYFICTSAKFYVGIIHSFSSSAKQKAQLQNTWQNFKTNCTTAKKSTMAIFLCPLCKLMDDHQTCSTPITSPKLKKGVASNDITN